MGFQFFQDQITDSSIRLEVLDYFVFEGFDFIIRLILSIFAERSSKIVLMEGSELNKYLNDDATFFSEYVVDFEQVLSFQPDLIKFENEYHLLHANSLNNNSNELINLKEINEDLRIKINDLSTQLKDLSTTHHEILDQSESFKEQLKVAQDERSKLEFTRDEIKNKYELLTMKDNVRNTKRANADFSKRSGELEAQIKQIKESIEKKKAKLEKLQPAVAA